MIKRFFARLKAFFSSMRMRFVMVFLLAIAIGLGAYILVHRQTYSYIDSVYISEENKKERENSYIEDLQDFVNKNGISSDTTSRLSLWARENKYVYLIIKGSEIFYTTDDLLSQPEEEPEEKPTETPEQTPEDTPDDLPDQTPGDAPENNPEDAPDEMPDDSDGGTSEDAPEENAGEDKENTDSEKESESDEEDKKPTYKEPAGVTIRYPSREELFEYAQQNDMRMITLADDVELLVYLTEFTEYFYYDVANITSVIVAVLFVLIILIVYTQFVASRIIRLGNEVNRVADGDVNHEIRMGGKDEIARLSKNVDDMRESMIENFEKEREALEANAALITSMSHDIRTPLTVLLGYIDVMQNKSEGNPEMQSYLKAAESTAMRLKKLSDDMFGYFLVFGGRELEIEMENYDAATIIEQMLLEHVTLMREQGQSVELSDFDYEALSGMEVRTDAQKLMRIFDNVFSNINKYSDKSYPVVIDVTQSAYDMTVRIINHISVSTEEVESNGIGLKTCEKLSEYMDVDFRYEKSENTFAATLTFKLYKTSIKDN